jgi:hypothetical protein
MEEIQIDITITMGEAYSNTMSLTEAQALYKKLDKIFGNKKQVIDKYENRAERKETRLQARPTGEILHENAKRMKEKALEENTEPNSPKPKMPPPNLKVEAARERAAERTRGCGQR